MDWTQISLTAAAALMALTALVHLFAGGPEVMTPLRDAALHPVLWLYILLTWHFVSAFLILSAGGLALAAWQPGSWPGLVLAVTALCLAMAGLFLAFGLRILGTPWTAPQWMMFLVIAALCLPALLDRL